MDLDKVKVNKDAKKRRMRPTSSHLDGTSLVNKEFYYMAFRERVIAEHGVILGKQDIIILPT